MIGRNLPVGLVFFRAVAPHSFFADPDLDPTAFLNADPDPAETNL